METSVCIFFCRADAVPWPAVTLERLTGSRRSECSGEPFPHDLFLNNFLPICPLSLVAVFYVQTLLL